VRRIEAVSFVNPKRVPQMAGAEEVMAGAVRGGVKLAGLVLNARGWDRAVDAECDEANVVLTASDAFGIRNQGANVAEQLTAAAAIAERAASEGGPRLTATIGLSFGCPFEGEISEDRVVAIVRELAALGYREIALADTIGVADPWTVRRRVEAARKVAGDIPLRLHLHNTRNTGLANAYAGVEAGIDILDASIGGIGGCPFAPAATGNIATEDLVYMLNRAGLETGLDLDGLIAAGQWVCDKLGKTPPSALTRVGVFPPKVEMGACGV
jgi:hydroxymethylglutaryl-CoA lyase